MAEEVIRAITPMELGIAETAEERERVYRMRYETVVEQGWGKPEDFPDGLEKEPIDDEALHIVCHDRGRLAGTVRMVLPSPPRLLPLEEAYEMRIEPFGEVVDGGRLVIAHDYRGEPRHQVLLGLFGAFWLEARKHGFERIAAVAPRKVIGLYEDLGFDVTVLGEPRYYWGDERYPIMIAGTQEQARAVLHEVS